MGSMPTQTSGNKFEVRDYSKGNTQTLHQSQPCLKIIKAMDTDPGRQDGTYLADNENQKYLSAVHTWETRIRSEHFLPIQEKLLSALALSQSQQAVFEGVTSFARMFGVRLLSDAISVKVTDLLSKPQPEVLEADISYDEDDILWADVIGELQFEPQLQRNGNYLCRVQKRNALIEMSAWDHDLISARRKLVHPQAYLSDILAERDTLDLMMSALSSCNEIALRFIETNKAILTNLTYKVQALEEGLSNISCSSQPSLLTPCSYHSSRGGPNSPQFESDNEGVEMTRSVDKDAASSQPRRWESQDLKRLPRWFKEHENLSDDAIEKHFEGDFRHFRSCSAIRAAVWRVAQKNGGWRRQKKRVRRRNIGSVSTTIAITQAFKKTEGRRHLPKPDTSAKEASIPTLNQTRLGLTGENPARVACSPLNQLQPENTASQILNYQSDPAPPSTRLYGVSRDGQNGLNQGTRSPEKTVTDGEFLSPQPGIDHNDSCEENEVEDGGSCALHTTHARLVPITEAFPSSERAIFASDVDISPSRSSSSEHEPTLPLTKSPDPRPKFLGHLLN